jgi:hypothetical protein
MRRGTEHFPRRVDSVDDLPEQIAAAVRQYQAEADIERLVDIPPQAFWAAQDKRQLDKRPLGWLERVWRRRPTPRRILVFGREQITIVECGPYDSVHDVIDIPLTAIVQIDLVSVLLYARIDFIWIQGDAVEMFSIEYPGIGSRYVEPGLDQVRAEIRARAAYPSLTHDATDRVDYLPLKFRNYMRDSLLPDERVAAVVFEPSLAEPGRYFRPTLAPDRAVAVTGSHIIVVESGLNRREYDSYKMVQRYYPRHQIRDVTFEPSPDGVQMRLTFGSASAVYEDSLLLCQSGADALDDTLTDWVQATPESG